MLTNQMQEVEMLFVLVENIVNQLLLVPAHHVVILSPFFEHDSIGVAPPAVRRCLSPPGQRLICRNRIFS